MMLSCQNQGPDILTNALINWDRKMDYPKSYPKTNAVKALLRLPPHQCIKSPPLGHRTSCNKGCSTLVDFLLKFVGPSACHTLADFFMTNHVEDRVIER